MKKILFFIFGIVGICLLSPWITGKFIETQIVQLQQSLTPSSPIQLIQQEYQRHWFSSTIQSDLQIKAGASLAPQQLMLQQTIQHGFQPIEATIIDSQIVLTPLAVTKPPLFQLNSQPIFLHSVVSSTLQQEHRLHTSKLILHAPEQAVLNLHSLAATLAINAKKFLQTATLQIAEFEYTHPTGQVTGQQFTMTSAWQPSAWESILQQAIFELAKARLYAVETIEFEKNQLSGNNTIQQGLLHSHWQYQAQTWKVAQQRYQTPQVEIEFKRWHLPTLIQLQQKLTGGMSLSTYQRSLLFIEIFTQYLATLIHYQPEIVLKKASFTTDAGLTTVSMRIQLLPVTPKALISPETLLAINGELQLPRAQLLAWLTQNGEEATIANNQINALIAQDWFKEKAEQYLAMQFQFIEGQWSFNSSIKP